MCTKSNTKNLAKGSTLALYLARYPKGMSFKEWQRLKAAAQRAGGAR